MGDDVEAMKSNRKLQSAMKKRRLEAEHNERMEKLYAYYAGTEVPLSRVAQRLGVGEMVAMKKLSDYGRRVSPD